MSSTIARRVGALKGATDKTENVGIVIALKGQTTEQAPTRLGLSDDDGVLRFVVVPLNAGRKAGAA